MTTVCTFLAFDLFGGDVCNAANCQIPLRMTYQGVDASTTVC